MLGFCFSVVSSSHNINLVTGAIAKFIKSIPTFIANSTEEFYSNQVNALITSKEQPPSSLSNASSFIWSEIEERRFEFRRRFEQSSILHEALPSNSEGKYSRTVCGQETMTKFSQEFLLGKNKKLLVVVAAPLTKAVNKINVFGHAIQLLKDPTNIHAECTLYPNLV